VAQRAPHFFPFRVKRSHSDLPSGIMPDSCRLCPSLSTCTCDRPDKQTFSAGRHFTVMDHEPSSHWTSPKGLRLLLHTMGQRKPSGALEQKVATLSLLISDFRFLLELTGVLQPLPAPAGARWNHHQRPESPKEQGYISRKFLPLIRSGHGSTGCGPSSA